MKLTASQRRAIEHDGRNLQLIACAGSGKTEVVARRVVHLLTPGRPDSLVPANIVAFTFTEKAAAELKERIYRRTKEVSALADRFVADMHAELQARWGVWRLDLEKQEVHEVVGALLARQVTLARELAQAPSTWNYHIGPIVLRAMADVYISLAWVLNDPVERARRFIHYGLGQEKLQLEHRKAELKGREPTPEEKLMFDATERWIDAQRYSFLTEVDVGSWSGVSTRQMAEQCGCLDFYNYVYQPFSACSHSMWHHIGKYNVKQCGNPLHRYHLAPDDPEQLADLDLLRLAGKYVEKTFRLFDEKTGVAVTSPSAFEGLQAGMVDLARSAARPASPPSASEEESGAGQ